MATGESGDAFDAVVVGAGPNGLSAALTLARAGLSVHVLEAAATPGGGCRSAALTLPGFVHDVCAAVHPMGALSPAFRAFDLEKCGLEWLWSDLPLAHPLPDGRVACLDASLPATARRLGSDAQAWEDLFGPLLGRDFLASLLEPMWRIPRGTWSSKLRFGPLALRSAEGLARAKFGDPATRALFAGCAAHSVLALDRLGTASFGLALILAAHVVGWPVARGGSQRIIDALVRCLNEAGGSLTVGRRITAWRELPPTRAVLFDVNPAQIAQICGDELPGGYRRKLERFRHGPGVFKVDWALSRPIPWRHEECARALTVHVGGTLEQIAQSEWEMAHGRVPERPFVLVAQQSLVDASRSPQGKHTGWAYCHVPANCRVDFTDRIEAQIEHYAPGFRDCIEARHPRSPADIEAENPAMVGGDIGGGANNLLNFLFRPVLRLNPYATPNPRIFVCSSSTPPGGGVHGMCGWQAAQTVLRRVFGRG